MISDLNLVVQLRQRALAFLNCRRMRTHSWEFWKMLGNTASSSSEGTVDYKGMLCVTIMPDGIWAIMGHQENTDGLRGYQDWAMRMRRRNGRRL